MSPMGRPPRKLSEWYKTSAVPFFASGLVFLIIGLATGEIVVFLIIGMALVVTGMGFGQRSRKSTNGEQEDSSE